MPPTHCCHLCITLLMQSFESTSTLTLYLSRQCHQKNPQICLTHTHIQPPGNTHTRMISPSPPPPPTHTHTYALPLLTPPPLPSATHLHLLLCGELWWAAVRVQLTVQLVSTRLHMHVHAFSRNSSSSTAGANDACLSNIMMMQNCAGFSNNQLLPYGNTMALPLSNRDKSHNHTHASAQNLVATSPLRCR